MSFVLISPPAGAGGTAPTVRDCRRVLAQELGWWHEYRVSQASAGTPEANRYLVIDELTDDDSPPERLVGCYAYVRTGAQAGATRRIVGTGYDGSLGAGLVSRPFVDVVETGTWVEVSRPLPVRQHLDRKGHWEILAEALSRIVVEARLPLVGTGSREVPLVAWPWLTDQHQTRGLYDRRSGSLAGAPTARRHEPYQIRRDTATTTLVTPWVYGVDEPFELAVAAPAHQLLSSDGGTTWAYFASSTFLTEATDDWQVAAPEAWVRAFGMVKALQHLIDVSSEEIRRLSEDDGAGRDVGPSLSDAQRQRRIAAQERLVAQYIRRLPTYALAAAEIATYEFSRPTTDPNDGLVAAESAPTSTAMRYQSFGGGV